VDVRPAFRGPSRGAWQSQKGRHCSESETQNQAMWLSGSAIIRFVTSVRGGPHACEKRPCPSVCGHSENPSGFPRSVSRYSRVRVSPTPEPAFHPNSRLEAFRPGLA
jgi:hypothetical protein